MTHAGAQVSRVINALTQRGHKYVGRDEANRLTFHGSLRCNGKLYPVSVSVDPKGIELPAVRLLDIPSSLRPFAPHLSADGYLCYAAKGSICLDVFDLPGQTLACLDQAASVLAQVLRQELVPDLEEEFFAYWIGAPCLLDIRQSSNQRLVAIVGSRGTEPPRVLAISNDSGQTTKKLHSLGFSTSAETKVEVRRRRTSVSPRPILDHWPPRTVHEVLCWQAALDKPSRKKLEEHILGVFRSGARGMLCVVETPKLIYAFKVHFDRSTARAKGVRNFTGTPYSRVRDAKVFPLVCHRIDDQYLAKRSLPASVTLGNRHIAVIGCGTIGGYLAEMLVKVGAGTGNGELILVDNEILLPRNVGRHRLGFNRVFENKAEALASELVRGAPTASIRALPADALEANLKCAEFVIDATGEESLSHLLAPKLQQGNFTPSLTVWIEGPGSAIRGLLREAADAACPRCLINSARTSLYPVASTEIPIILGGQGCEEIYVPFAATVSAQAACLGTEMVMAWANGATSPRLRTRIIDTNFTKQTPDLDPRRLPECPACGT